MIRALASIALALLAAAANGKACDWTEPGQNPFVGDRHAAVMSYAAIPAVDRLLLAWRVRFGRPTDRVKVGATGVTGSSLITYGDIHGMHFGRKTVCETVSRSAWPTGHFEMASAYRQGNWCVVVPDVCGNISIATCDASPISAARAVGARAVPEPGALLLALIALIAALWFGRRR